MYGQLTSYVAMFLPELTPHCPEGNFERRSMGEKAEKWMEAAGLGSMALDFGHTPKEST